MTLTRLVASTLLVATAATVASAQSVSWSEGTVATTPGPIQSEVRANEMGPMTLTAHWGGFSQQYTFGDLGGGTWGFSGSDLRIEVNGGTDSYFAFWYLNHTRSERLTGLTFSAAGTNVMFDRSVGFLGLGEGTPGSDIGYDYTAGDICFFVFICSGGGSVHYTDAVALDPNGPVYDVFRTMEVTFGGEGIAQNRRSWKDEAVMRFDTDLAHFPDPSEVPEPASLALLALGVAGVAISRRRRA